MLTNKEIYTILANGKWAKVYHSSDGIAWDDRIVSVLFGKDEIHMLNKIYQEALAKYRDDQ